MDHRIRIDIGVRNLDSDQCGVCAVLRLQPAHAVQERNERSHAVGAIWAFRYEQWRYAPGFIYGQHQRSLGQQLDFLVLALRQHVLSRVPESASNLSFGSRLASWRWVHWCCGCFGSRRCGRCLLPTF